MFYFLFHISSAILWIKAFVSIYNPVKASTQKHPTNNIKWHVCYPILGSCITWITFLEITVFLPSDWSPQYGKQAFMGPWCAVLMLPLQAEVNIGWKKDVMSMLPMRPLVPNKLNVFPLSSIPVCTARNPFLPHHQ